MRQQGEVPDPGQAVSTSLAAAAPRGLLLQQRLCTSVGGGLESLLGVFAVVLQQAQVQAAAVLLRLDVGPRQGVRGVPQLG